MKLTIEVPVWPEWHGGEIVSVEKLREDERGGVWQVETVDQRQVVLYGTEIAVSS